MRMTGEHFQISQPFSSSTITCYVFLDLQVFLCVSESVLGTGRLGMMCRALDNLKKPPQMILIQLFPCLISLNISNLGFVLGKSI